MQYKNSISILKTFLLTFFIFFSGLSKADKTEDIIAELSNAYGVSGFEKPVRDILEKHWKSRKINYQIDGMGNLVGKSHNFSEKKPTILIMAHMDEVGFMTKKINNEGFITVNNLGGWLDHVVWSQQWVINVNGKYIPAISGMDAPHVLTDFTKTPVANKGMMFLDTGLTKAELDELGVRPGLPVIPDFKFKILKKNKRYAGKAFDDRAGLSVMLELMDAVNSDKNLTKKVNIVFAATVQEELGMRGSKAVYDSLKPNLVLNIEAGIAKDYPAQFTQENQPKLGGGPAVFIYDGSMMPNQNLVELISKVAIKNNIPMQWESENSYGQDASCLQSAGKGMPAVNIGIPVRYVHSHIGMMDRDDYNNTLLLLKKVILTLDQKSITKLH